MRKMLFRPRTKGKVTVVGFPVEKKKLPKQQYENMSTFRVSYLFLYFVITRNHVGCNKWVDDLTEYVVESSKFKPVPFITEGSEKKSIENPLVEELLIKLTSKVPVVRINFDQDFKLPAISGSGSSGEGKTLIDTWSAFFVIVIESRDSLPIPRAKKLIDAVAGTSSFRFNPKYLLISVAENPSDSFQGLLEHAWTRKMLHFTGLEVVKSTDSPIIHRLNPFKKEYTRRHWIAGASDLFPHKSNDLWGFSLTIGVHEEPSEMEFRANPSLRLLDALVQQLNCSVKYVVLPSLLRNSDRNALHSEMLSNDVDLVPVLYPYEPSYVTKVQLTRVIRTDGIYFIVPVLTREAFRLSTNFFAGLLLTSGIIFIFWLTMRLLRGASYPWKVLVIAQLIFGMSVNSQPRRNVDRIVFTCLLAICAFYSSTLYTAITDFTWETSSEIAFETFDDLANSELVFHGDEKYLKQASEAFGGPSVVPQRRFVEHRDSVGCVRVLNGSKNVACLMDKSTALVLMMTYNPRGPRTMKLAKPCLVTENYGFPVGTASPYRATIDKSIRKFQSMGLIDKLYHELDEELEKLRNKFDKKTADDENSLGIRLIVVSVVGYSLSFIVLLGEIIFHRISVYVQSKMRPIIDQ